MVVIVMNNRKNNSMIQREGAGPLRLVEGFGLKLGEVFRFGA